jgi:hypothetical protein
MMRVSSLNGEAAAKTNSKTMYLRRMDPALALSLAETIAWVTKHALATDAGRTTRSAALRPPWFPPDGGATDGVTLIQLLLTPGEPRRALDFIVAQRRAELAKGQVAVGPSDGDFAGGRILCTDFNSDQCCAATDISGGFLDDEDIAGFDTWFHHLDTGEHGGVIACWVPPHLLNHADRGVNVIPVQSAWWDDEAPPERRLF